MTGAGLTEMLLGRAPARAGLGYGVAASDPAGSGGDAGTAGGGPPRPHPAEAAAAAGMLPRRREDFLLGRTALRLAVAAVTGGDGPILGCGRRPALPTGIVGSVSHSGGVAVAIAAAASRYRCLGIDVETGELPLAAAHLVLGEPERAWLAGGRTPAVRQRRLLRAFCAKEAAYKALDAVLDQGAPPLRRIRLAATRAGFTAWAGQPSPALHVTVHDLRLAMLAWTALPAGRVPTGPVLAGPVPGER